MNVVAIILVIIVILLVYMLYRYFIIKSVELADTANLNAVNDAITLTNNPSSLRYSYGIWIYVNSWDASREKTIFSRDSGNVKLYLSQTAPILNLDITLNDESTKTLEITDNFPIQKWAHVVISADNQYIDGYIDGKLVKSGRMNNISNNGSESSPKAPQGNLTLGSGIDIYITTFQHWSEPLAPQTVLSEYLKGNGQGGLGMKSFMASYGVDLSILKDNVEQTKFSIF